ncbi:hypothetical protein I302_101240 [Kwoniella bestiolae CBS 10118]|uniref:Flavin reductase like domain-containing protein n=1 Tax=Kwoniella bestiolae CBS 10118 TaxID=1296100 RepID=A0A1B9G7E5_9TREE|nr:hypothetical protein I302_04612 [Kwoniella bestiolae CBS 10118]OCF26921.1 hypothetical protein I302_04612 [Kwoniella bestiolae CBS 10118]
MFAVTSTRSAIRSWRKSPVRFLKGAYSDRTGGDEQDPSILLREVMRNVAQPVAIAVTCVPPNSPLHGKAKYHGATLTSFTSLTLYPHPLVAFSLRLPSRMADCLRPYRTHGDHQQRQSSPSSSSTDSSASLQQERIMNGSLENTHLPSPRNGITLPPKSELPWPLSKLPMPEQPPQWAKSLFAQIPNPLMDDTSPNPLTPTLSSPLPQNAHYSSAPSSTRQTTPPPPKTILTSHPTPLTISLLSKSNERIADSLSLPRTDHSSIFALEDTWTTHTSHPPSLKGSIGSLQCEIVGSVLLKDLCGSAISPETGARGEGSELFICRVIGVEMSEEEGLEPLLHWRRKYVGIKDDAE